MDKTKLKCLELAISAIGGGSAIVNHGTDIIDLAKKIEAYLIDDRSGVKLSQPLAGLTEKYHPSSVSRS